MPRHFDDRERSAIRAALLKKGRELFARQGLAKVSVDELCTEVRIAKGSFYAFFSSKEELFLSIIKEDEASMRQEISGILADTSLAPREQFKRLYAAQLEALERYPMLRAASRPETYTLLSRRLPPEALEDDRDEEFIAGLIQGWKSRGFECRYTVRQLVDLSRAIFFVYLHREDGQLGDSLVLLLDLLSSALIRKGPTNE
jgi:AcrR family transcriptional regulator